MINHPQIRSATERKASRFDLANIPLELATCPQWVAWEWTMRKGKRTKPPLDPLTGSQASSTDSTTWASLDVAVAFASKSDRAAGIGFVFSPNDPFAGVDLDKCRDPNTGQIQPWAQSIITYLDSYTEVSPSGTGAKVFVRSHRSDGLKRGNVEIYWSGRYFTVTGERLPESRASVNDRAKQVELLSRWLRRPAPSPARPLLVRPAIDDQALLQRAKAAKNGAEFERLWNGDWSSYSSQSEADLALCNALAFWTRHDAPRIDALFRRSGLFRPKWDEPHFGDGRTYGQATVTVAMSAGVASGRNGAPPPIKVAGDHVPEEGDDNLLETDLGNATRMAKRCGANFRYCFTTNRFHIWDGRRWAADETGEIERLAKGTARSVFEEAKEAPTTDRSKQLAQHAVRSQAEQRLAAMVRLVRSEPGIPVVPSELDRDPWLFNVINGTVDLKTGNLKPHARADLITKLSPVRFDPDASCSTWLAFLDRIMAGDEDVIRFLQKAIGYSLTGDVSEQVVFFLHGVGANGKSTLLSLLLELLGDYGRQAAPGLLTLKRGESHPTELADLAGARFVAAIEVDEGRRLAEALTKWLTGGDRLKARFMRQDFFEFSPTHKLWLAANHRPTVTGSDHAIWRRLRLIPFEVSIPEAEQDKLLGNKLRQELPGVLNWTIEGCLAWQRDGLAPPEKVILATNSYREEQDVLTSFLRDRCVEGEDRKATAKELYEAYRTWSDENGDSAMSQKSLGTRLSERGFTSHRGTGGLRWWAGLGLVTHPGLGADTSDG